VTSISRRHARAAARRDPALRPASALAVAAAQPDANHRRRSPPATPSPELVASVGGTAAMNVWLAFALGVFVVVGVLAASFFADRVLMVAHPF
jgi:hypothetical protein